MKKIISLVIVLAMLFANTGTTFASDVPSKNHKLLYYVIALTSLGAAVGLSKSAMLDTANSDGESNSARSASYFEGVYSEIFTTTGLNSDYVLYNSYKQSAREHVNNARSLNSSGTIKGIAGGVFLAIFSISLYAAVKKSPEKKKSPVILTMDSGINKSSVKVCYKF